MPLSEQEQRLLEEMERSLYHNDADFVAGSTNRHGRPTYARVVTGVLIGIVGVATMIAGVGVRLPIVGVVGFILMFAGVLIALTPSRGALPGASSAKPSSASHSNDPGADSSRRWENHPDDQDE